MRTILRAALVGILAAAIGGLAGCSNDVLESSTSNVAFRYVPSPAGAGRYETARLDLFKIQVLPEDPALAAVYGTDQLLFRFSPFTLNLAATQTATISNIGLPPGTYVVKLIQFTPPQLIDQNLPATPSSCIEKIAALPSGPAGPQVPSTFDYADEPSLTFTLPPGQATLSLTVDVPALVSGFESAFTCQDDCGGGQACLTAFDAPAFSDALLASISLH
ncbi:MAG TPA: hypothetical protein VFB67_05910 [Candidatus Polarisedimenticolaceae bacterium]|nr:hypothetical protein [Candidatus Polarisedimenticolaceae bacterium]